MRSRSQVRLRVGLSCRQVLALAAVALAVLAAHAASTGRLRVSVRDEEGNPLAGVAVRVTFPGTGQTREAATDSEGQATISALPGGENVARFEKEGFQIYEKNVRILVGGTEQLDATLSPLIRETPPEELSEEEIRRRKGIASFNEAVTLYDAGDLEAALAAVKTALENDASLAQADVLVAKIASRQDRPGDAAGAYIRALEKDPSLSSVIPALITELQKAGRSAEATAYSKKLETASAESPAQLYNMAIVKINAAEDDGAMELLQRALSLDAGHSLSLYQRGMIFMRRGEMAKAKADLVRYLEIAPQGEFAADAREILKALGG